MCTCRGNSGKFVQLSLHEKSHDFSCTIMDGNPHPRSILLTDWSRGVPNDQ